MLASNPAKALPAKSLVTAFRDWLHHRRLISQCRQRLEACDQNEIARIAHDVGLSAQDLRRLSHLGPDAAELLFERLYALHLDADAIAKSEPGTMRDLQRLCSNCVAKGRCQRDLLLRPDDPKWRQYCPNVDTLDLLRSESADIR